MCDRTVYLLTGVVERKLSLMLVKRKISETLLPARCISLPLTFIPILLRSSVLCLSSLPILRTHAKRNTNSIIRDSPLLLVPCFYKCFSLRLLLSLPWSKMSRRRKTREKRRRKQMIRMGNGTWNCFFPCYSFVTRLSFSLVSLFSFIFPHCHLNYIFMYLNYLPIYFVAERRGWVVKSHVLYSGDSTFRSRPGARLSLLRFSWIFSVSPGKCRVSALKIGHDRLLPQPFQFIIHPPSFHLTLWSLSYWECDVKRNTDDVLKIFSRVLQRLNHF
jgi:hypothetical protein